MKTHNINAVSVCNGVSKFVVQCEFIEQHDRDKPEIRVVQELNDSRDVTCLLDFLPHLLIETKIL